MIKVMSDKLFMIAGVIWAIAGASILQIGLHACFSDAFDWWVLPTAILVFSVFYFMIFHKMLERNEARIMSIQESKVSALLFLDKRGYTIMFFMMALGVALRVSGLVPVWFFAFFYTGLGAALLVAGFGFALKYFKYRRIGGVQPKTAV